MEKSARQLFAGVGPEGHETRFAGTRGTVRFEIRGAGTWLLEIDDGRYAIHEGAGNADLVVKSDEEDFAHVMEGRHNFITAVLQNRLEASGDVGLLLKLQGVLRARSHERATGEAG